MDRLDGERLLYSVRVPALTRRRIQEINRPHPVGVVGPADFITDPDGEVSPETVWEDPRFSLYCFDREADAAIFVETDDPEAIDRHPFYYQGQIEHAVATVTMPLEIFQGIARAQLDPPRLILVHSTGRCGSTLLSKALEAAPSVHSLSEPDDLTQLIKLRFDGASDEWIKSALRSSIGWRGKPRAGGPFETLAIKTRAEVLNYADLIAATFPTAGHMFLYRDGVSWMRSVMHGWPPDADLNDPVGNARRKKDWSRTIRLLSEPLYRDAPLNAIEIRTLGWVNSMEGFFALRAAGVPVTAARYEDLSANPIAILRALFDACRIPDVNWATVAEVLTKDSQAGTVFSRAARRANAIELMPDQEEFVRGIIAGRPLLLTPDVILPGTVKAPAEPKVNFAEHAG